MDVAEDVRDADAAGNPDVVEAAEAAGDHSGRGAVAPLARAAEPEARPLAPLNRIERSAEHGAAVDVGARVELELDEDIAPVGGHDLERRVPGFRERALCDCRLGDGGDR